MWLGRLTQQSRTTGVCWGPAEDCGLIHTDQAGKSSVGNCFACGATLSLLDGSSYKANDDRSVVHGPTDVWLVVTGDTTRKKRGCLTPAIEIKAGRPCGTPIPSGDSQLARTDQGDNNATLGRWPWGKRCISPANPVVRGCGFLRLPGSRLRKPGVAVFSPGSDRLAWGQGQHEERVWGLRAPKRCVEAPQRQTARVAGWGKREFASLRTRTNQESRLVVPSRPERWCISNAIEDDGKECRPGWGRARGPHGDATGLFESQEIGKNDTCVVRYVRLLLEPTHNPQCVSHKGEGSRW